MFSIADNFLLKTSPVSGERPAFCLTEHHHKNVWFVFGDHGLSLQNVKISFIVCLIILVVLFQIWKFLQKLNHKRKLYETIPTFETSRFFGKFLGHLEYFWVANNRTIPVPIVVANLLNGLALNCRHNNVGLLHIRLGPFRDIVFFMNAQVAEALLKHPRNIIKSDEYFFMKPWLGQGLLTGAGAHWRQHRKLLTPTFHFDILNKFLPTMNRQLHTLIAIINQNKRTCGSETKIIVDDIRPLAINCTMDIICETAMGIRLNVQQDWLDWKRRGSDPTVLTTESDYVEALRNFFDIMIERLISPWLHPDWIFNLHPSGRKFHKHVQTMHDFTNQVIHRRKLELQQNYDPKLSLEESIKRISLASGRRLAFLDLMILYHLNDPQEFDLVSIREEVDTFMFGGHDTTSSTLYFAMMLIGLNPDKQELIAEELDSIFGDDIDREIEDSDLKQMHYLEQCIKESLRLYPAAAFFARKITEPFQCGPYQVPAGCTAVVLSSAVHRDPDVYKNAEHFLPERFGQSENVHHNPFAFVPFSAGPRNCIGQKFAMLELKLFLASILRRFTIRSLTQRDTILVDFSIISKSSTPIRMEFIERQHEL